jgi:hypothetical protein
MASLNSQQAPVRPVQGTGQTGATQTSQTCGFNLESSPPLSSSIQERPGGEATAITVPEIRLPGESSLLFEICQESNAKDSLGK